MRAHVLPKLIYAGVREPEQVYSIPHEQRHESLQQFRADAGRPDGRRVLLARRGVPASPTNGRSIRPEKPRLERGTDGLREAIALLDPSEGLVVILHIVHDRTFDDSANELKIPRVHGVRAILPGDAAAPP